MEKLTIIQKKIDTHKWFNGQRYGYDMSGNMDYCKYCDALGDGNNFMATNCTIGQDEREACLLCAKAYSKMKRQKKGGK